MRRKCI